MKLAINVILGLCAAALLFICYSSIHDTEEVEGQIKQREAVVKSKLIDIRLVQEEYKKKHTRYCDNWDTLVYFIHNEKVAEVLKNGELNDFQLEHGLTEAKAVAIVNSGNEALIKENGLEGFARDTTWLDVVDLIRRESKEDFATTYDVDSISYIPFSDGEQFELDTREDTLRSGTWVYMMECKAPIRSYFKNMGRLGDMTIRNREKEVENNNADINAYAGLKIGIINKDNWNNNAGNWE